jgi:hypothetical protein
MMILPQPSTLNPQPSTLKPKYHDDTHLCGEHRVDIKVGFRLNKNGNPSSMYTLDRPVGLGILPPDLDDGLPGVGFRVFKWLGLGI